MPPLLIVDVLADVAEGEAEEVSEGIKEVLRGKFPNVVGVVNTLDAWEFGVATTCTDYICMHRKVEVVTTHDWGGLQEARGARC